MPTANRPVFEAMIVPHRSPRGDRLRLLVGFICLLSGGLSAGLYLVGAWPVVAAFGLEIGLAVFLLRRHALGARASEMLLLSDAGLRLVRTDARGRRSEHDLQPAWLGVALEERPGRTPALWLSNRGRRLEVGAVLGEDEKRELADALRAALHRWRHPVFDNPQLRN